MKVLIPIKVVPSMLTSSTVAEPAAGETAWVSGGSYTVGDKRIRTETHRVYMALTTHTGKTDAPENDPTNWKNIGPTLRWAMFDNYINTRTQSVTTMTVVFKPGFFNAIALYNCVGRTITVTVKDSTGGTVIYTYTGDLYEPFDDWYEWLFYPYRDLKTLVLQGILPYDTAEVTVTITAASGADVGIGLITCGDLRSLISSGAWGGTQYGAKVELVDYSYVKTDEYGETTIVKRHSATDMRVSVIMPSVEADYATGVLVDALATPCAWIATDAKGCQTLSVFGLGSGAVERVGPTIATAEITVRGLI